MIYYVCLYMYERLVSSVGKLEFKFHMQAAFVLKS
jgi:hypothetical protein